MVTAWHNLVESWDKMVTSLLMRSIIQFCFPYEVVIVVFLGLFITFLYQNSRFPYREIWKLKSSSFSWPASLCYVWWMRNLRFISLPWNWTLSMYENKTWICMYDNLAWQKMKDFMYVQNSEIIYIFPLISSPLKHI